MYYSWKLAAALLPLAAVTQAALLYNRGCANSAPRPSVPIVTAEDVPRTDQTGSTLPPITTVYYFDQLIDHTDPTLGTFQQRYWTTWEWYEAGRFLFTCETRSFLLIGLSLGGPIILNTPGEDNAERKSEWIVSNVDFTHINHSLYRLLD